MPKTRECIIYEGHDVKIGLTTDAGVESCETTHPSYDVVVIGAGFCGLVSARNLSRIANFKVLLLEARDRIDGLKWTSKAWREDFEMGGTWVQW